MAYYFMTEKKKGEYIPLDITQSKYFTKLSKYNKKGALSLEEIDIFTTSFEDEFELRIKLAKEGILPHDCIDKPLTARLLNKGKYSKVTYDFLYQKDIEYIIDSSKIIDVILDKYYQKDYLFLKKLGEHFQNFYDCKSTAADVRNYAHISILRGNNYNYLDKIDKEGNLLVVRLAKLIIYDYYQDKFGNITYYNKVKYANLHHLISFINNYNKKYNINEPKKENNQVTFEEFIQKPRQEEVQIPKTKKRKKEQIDGQMRFFDEE